MWSYTEMKFWYFPYSDISKNIIFSNPIVTGSTLAVSMPANCNSGQVVYVANKLRTVRWSILYNCIAAHYKHTTHVLLTYLLTCTPTVLEVSESISLHLLRVIDTPPICSQCSAKSRICYAQIHWLILYSSANLRPALVRCHFAEQHGSDAHAFLTWLIKENSQQRVSTLNLRNPAKSWRPTLR